jgi:predicted DNA-binding protein YlxM (UPF0122 family)
MMLECSKLLDEFINNLSNKQIVAIEEYTGDIYYHIQEINEIFDMIKAL